MEQRDTAILHHEWAVSGRSTAEGFSDRHADLASLRPDDLATVKREVVEAVDDCLALDLLLFEQAAVAGFDVVYRGTHSHR